mmetsp:Transcript_34248/g.81942  ORF Transcript_34248/g.81942 Transcript_34248/m.81942 type:complete len:81 (-) Transcript_34248:261-503(-)
MYSGSLPSFLQMSSDPSQSGYQSPDGAAPDVPSHSFCIQLKYLEQQSLRVASIQVEGAKVMYMGSPPPVLHPPLGFDQSG